MNKQQIKLIAAQIDELKSLQFSRKSSKEEFQRTLAILLIDENSSCDIIYNMTGFKRTYASHLRKKYIKYGLNALLDKVKNYKKLLTKGQIVSLFKMIRTTNPMDYGIESKYWSVPIVAQLIKEFYGVIFKSKTSICLIFKEIKFTYHKPDTVYKNKKQEVTDLWIKKQTAVIKNLQLQKDVEVFVSDEMILTTQTGTQKIWLPEGEFPKIEVSNKRDRRCIYGYLNTRTGQEYAFKTLKCNSEATIETLEKIGILHPNKKIAIVWDNASWHRSALVKAFLATTAHDFHFINFPPYSPELNPQEHVWKDGRSKITHNNFIENIDKATDAFIEHLNTTVFEYKFL